MSLFLHFNDMIMAPCEGFVAGQSWISSLSNTTDKSRIQLSLCQCNTLNRNPGRCITLKLGTESLTGSTPSRVTAITSWLSQRRRLRLSGLLYSPLAGARRYSPIHLKALELFR